MTDPTPTPQPSGPGPSRLSDRRYRLFVAAALGGAALALVLGYQATQTDDTDPITSSGQAEAVEHLIPRQGASVLRQAELGIDLAPGFEGTLLVNGVEIPADELRLVPEQNQVFFTPGEDKTVERLPAGQSCVTAVVWESAVGRDPATDLAFQWCFEAL